MNDKTKSLHENFQQWFLWQLGKKSERFVGEHGKLQALQTRLENAPDATRRDAISYEISRVKFRIKLMNGIMSKGWIFRPYHKRELNNHEAALYGYLKLLFLTQTRYDFKWDNPHYKFEACYARHYMRIKHYEYSRFTTHDDQRDEATRRCCNEGVNPVRATDN